MKTIVFCNQKGGVGKTASAINTAAALVNAGKAVLLIDTDPQGNATTSAGIRPQPESLTLYELLKGQTPAAATIQRTSGNYDIIPSDIRLSGADIELSALPGRDLLLKEALEPIQSNYDYCIIDAPPALSVVTLNDLTAADEAIITLKAEFLALYGVAQLRDTITLIQRRTNPDLEICGILLTFYDKRRTLDNQTRDAAEEAFPGKVFNTTISQAVAIAEAPAFGKDIFQYAPGSKAAKQYEQLTKEILERTGDNGNI